MGINCQEFLELVVQPTLKQLGETSPVADKLMLATACYQSEMGHHLKGSNGIGIFGINEELHQEVWDKHIAFDCDLASAIRGMASQHEFPKQPHVELATNLRYATAIAWMVYQYRDVTLPESDCPIGLAQCWQESFINRPIGFEERDAFIKCFNKGNPGSNKLAA